MPRLEARLRSVVQAEIDLASQAAPALLSGPNAQAVHREEQHRANVGGRWRVPWTGRSIRVQGQGKGSEEHLHGLDGSVDLAMASGVTVNYETRTMVCAVDDIGRVTCVGGKYGAGRGVGPSAPPSQQKHDR